MNPFALRPRPKHINTPPQLPKKLASDKSRWCLTIWDDNDDNDSGCKILPAGDWFYLYDWVSHSTSKTGSHHSFPGWNKKSRRFTKCPTLSSRETRKATSHLSGPICNPPGSDPHREGQCRWWWDGSPDNPGAARAARAAQNSPTDQCHVLTLSCRLTANSKDGSSIWATRQLGERSWIKWAFKWKHLQSRHQNLPKMPPIGNIKRVCSGYHCCWDILRYL